VWLQGPKLDEPKTHEEEKQVSPAPRRDERLNGRLNLLGRWFSGDPTPRSLKLMCYSASSLLVDDESTHKYVFE
jgi:hypothetical protein